MLTELVTAGVSNASPWYGAVEDNFDDVLDTINPSTSDPALVEAANYFKLYIYSGANGFTDQSGDPNGS